MAATFSFGFSGDDIDVDDEIDENENPTELGNQTSAALEKPNLPKLVEAERHQLQSWMTTLPSQISYNKLRLKISEDPDDRKLTFRLLGRREVFDIRAQLMAEDDNDHEELISGLEEGDIKPNFYEGGFKTWECALDLAKLISSDEETFLGISDEKGQDDVHVIELGCGAAMPSLAILARLLARPTPTSPPRRKFHFTLADYNSTVLRLVTLPNLLLTWRLNACQPLTAREDTPDQQDQEEEDEELDIDPALVEMFQNNLSLRGISIDFISGAWSRRFVDLALAEQTEYRPCRTLLLASETIYAPSSLDAFSQTLIELLRRPISGNGPSTLSRALIAAKKVYFGVGGGIDEFLHVLRQQQSNETINVRQKIEVKTEGVGRVILHVEI